MDIEFFESLERAFAAMDRNKMILSGQGKSKRWRLRNRNRSSKNAEVLTHNGIEYSHDSGKLSKYPEYRKTKEKALKDIKKDFDFADKATRVALGTGVGLIGTAAAYSRTGNKRKALLTGALGYTAGHSIAQVTRNSKSRIKDRNKIMKSSMTTNDRMEYKRLSRKKKYKKDKFFDNGRI